MVTQAPDQKKALDAAVAHIEKQFGKGSIMKLGSDNVAKGLDVIPTGSLGEIAGPMIAAAQGMAEAGARKKITGALAVLDTELSREIGRLQDLARINPNIRDAEIALARKERDVLRQAIAAARLRLDALRLICCDSPTGELV